MALRNGVRPADVLELAAQAAATRAPGWCCCRYLNTILAFGRARFFDRCRESGVLGVVVPDVPVEEAGELQATARARGVDVILLAAPTSTDERLARIAAAASGFIYCVSTTGVTGARAALRTDLPDFIARLRRHTDLPLAVGFGVSTAEQAEEVAGYADGVIIGSALVDMVARNERLEAALAEIGRLLHRGEEHALFLEVVLERLGAHAVESRKIGEVLLADGEHLACRVVAQLAQEGQVTLERPAFLGGEPVQVVEADAQGSVAGGRAREGRCRSRCRGPTWATGRRCRRARRAARG